MQTNLEQAIEIIKTLPPEDHDKIRKVLDAVEESKVNKKDKTNWQIERYKKARKWLDEHSQEYINQWVCLEGDKLIAHGKDGLEVHRKAKEAGIEIPFVHHIVPEVDWGGW
jgi:acetoin utilization deacetylase AcuC-like enzyme